MRLDKELSRRAGCSRSQARRWVRRGRVVVEGAVVRDPAAGVPEGASMCVDGVPVARPPRGAAFHKPRGVQCTVGDPWGRPSLEEVAAPLLTWGLHPVGRLDADSEGLLLFLADGRLTQRLLHPKHGVEKVYRASVSGSLPEDLDEQLAAGVATALGAFPARLIAACPEAGGGEVTLAVTEGKHRMVRRMLANLGLPVHRLVRLSIGSVALSELPVGAWRALGEEELARLSR